MVSIDDDAARAIAAARDRFSATRGGERVVFGFDGYVDRMRELVADRHDPDTYEVLDSMAAYEDRLSRSAANRSSLAFEWDQRGERAGGLTCHLARAFGKWSFDPVLVGTYGRPVRDIFESEFGEYDLHSIGDPGLTDAIEFEDGKLMLTENGDTTDLDWDGLIASVGRETLVDRLDGAALLGVGYWAETPQLPRVLDGISALWNDLDDPPETVLVDPGDVRKLDRDRLLTGRGAIDRLSGVTRVVLSANRAETARLAETYVDAKETADDETAPDVDDVATEARAIFDRLDVSLVVSHGIERSVAATAAGTTTVPVPTATEPELTTSAGDHFNAGLTLALLAGMTPGPAVVVGNAVAGLFVRTGTPPTLDEVAQFLATYERRLADAR